MKSLISLLFIVVSISTTFAQNLTISGIAPAYIGFPIEAYVYKDYLSKVERLVATTTVDKDSSFKLRLNVTGVEKLILKSKNNESFLFVQPLSLIHI